MAKYKKKKDKKSLEERFAEFQEGMLDYITRPRGKKGISYLDSWEEEEKLPSTKIKGKLKFLRGRPSKKYRRERALFHGYYGHELEIIEETEYNLGSTALWKRVRTIRWLEVYEECIGEGWNIKNLTQWQKAAAVIAIEKGNRTIWDILGDTQ